MTYLLPQETAASERDRPPSTFQVAQENISETCSLSFEAWDVHGGD